MSFVVAQLGARMHYAVPRLLHRHGMLDRLYTDICGAAGWPRLARALPACFCPAAVRRLAGRIPHGIPPARITAFTSFALDYTARRAKAKSGDEHYAVHLWAGQEFCRRVVKRGLGAADAVYGFNSSSLELLDHARGRGLEAILEQTIAPMEIEYALLAPECARFPDWVRPSERGLNWFEAAARERAEWDAATIIICGSEFVRDGIASCGGPVSKCVVVPYGFDPSAAGFVRETPRRPLRVLTVGAVGLRKGSPHVLRAAGAFGRTAEFRMVGPVNASPRALRTVPANVRVTGSAPRSEIAAYFAWADVFLLPTLCEGSATVCYEALASGLPVITTPNAGSVVRHGVEGLIVPIRDSDAIACALERLIAYPGLLDRLSRNALARSREFTVTEYGERLIWALLMAGREQEGLPALVHTV